MFGGFRSAAVLTVAAVTCALTLYVQQQRSHELVPARCDPELPGGQVGPSVKQ